MLFNMCGEYVCVCVSVRVCVFVFAFQINWNSELLMQRAMIYERNHLNRNEIQGAVFDFHKSF